MQVLAGGPLAVVRINRAERLNAFTSDTIDQLIAAFRRIRPATGIGAIVLTGAGSMAFSAGGDQK
ncbi:enoyl-CoA hydratase-related protein [Streptomyces sp. M10(2022)]